MTKRLAAALTIVLALAVTGVALAGSPASGSKNSYAPTIGVTWPLGPASATTSTPYVVGGCGYSSAYGGVTVVVTSPYAIQFAGQIPGEDGCISLTNFYTLGAGHYQIDAWQTLRHKDVIVASTFFDL